MAIKLKISPRYEIAGFDFLPPRIADAFEDNYEDGLKCPINNPKLNSIHFADVIENIFCLFLFCVNRTLSVRFDDAIERLQLVRKKGTRNQ